MPITRKAYAKINLCLDVLRRRKDGYHELRMIMQTVDLWDELTFSLSDAADEKGGKITLLVKNAPPGADLGPMEQNLIYRAAKLIYETYDIKTDVTITLDKHIPVAAGMAGGSTDAAAVFHGLNQLLALGMTKKEMCRLGVRLGADIPYCILGGTMLSEGIGEILSPLPSPPACYLLIDKPDIAVSTGYVYGNLRLDENMAHPDVDGMISAISNQDLVEMAGLLGNVLEYVTVEKYKIINVIKRKMVEQGALGALMSGSGPTVFGLYTKKETAEEAAARLRAEYPAHTILVTTFYPCV